MFILCLSRFYLAVMPERVLHVNDPLTAAIPRGSDDRVVVDDHGSDVSSIDESIHTAELYEDVSADDNFEEFNEEFIDEVNKLERKYFDSLHVEKAPTNVSYSHSTRPRGGQDKLLTDFEKDNFHSENVTPERPCSSYFRASQFVSAAEVFKALNDDRFTTEHIRCLQPKPSGEIYVTFRTESLRDRFIQQGSFSLLGKPHVANDAEGSMAFLTIYDAPYELPDAAIIHRLRPYCEVLWYRCGTFRAHNGVFNGLRHFRVHVRVLNSIQVFCVLENSLFVCTMMANLLLVVVAIDEVIKRPPTEIQCVLIAMV